MDYFGITDDPLVTARITSPVAVLPSLCLTVIHRPRSFQIPSPRPKNPPRTGSIPIARARLPQTRAASFKWLYRNRSGTWLGCSPKNCSPDRVRYSATTFRRSADLPAGVRRRIFMSVIPRYRRETDALGDRLPVSPLFRSQASRSQWHRVSAGASQVVRLFSGLAVSDHLRVGN
jgi:hypothetical protein